MSTPEDLEERARGLVLGGRLKEAALVCDELNRQFPDYASGWYTTSQIATVFGEPVLALQAVDRALYLSPGNPAWLLQRLECLGAVGDTASATALAQEIAQRPIDSAALVSDFGQILTKLGLFELAREQYERACRLEPGNGKHFFGLASVWRYLGDVESAQTAFERCLEVDPDNTGAMLQRSQLRTQTPENNNIVDLEAARDRYSENPPLLSGACYALAKELADVGDFRRSFEVLLEGSTLQRESVSYDPAIDLEALRAIPKCYGPQMFTRGIEGYVSAEPLFVFGMPLSGVTLVERVLVRHPAVQFAGELGTFAHTLMKHCELIPGPAARSTPEMVANSTSIDFAALGEDYLAGTRSVTGRSPHFVDNQPLNFQYAGLIHLALPKAKLILLERDPMDNYYAMFRSLFDGRYTFTYDMVELANYYAAYSQLMDHWQSVMPGVLHIVKYEELVTDPKPVIEKLLEHCSLSLNEDCLNANVRREESIGIWRNFAEQLQPAVDILESAGVSVSRQAHSR